MLEKVNPLISDDPDVIDSYTKPTLNVDVDELVVFLLMLTAVLEEDVDPHVRRALPYQSSPQAAPSSLQLEIETVC